MKRFEQENRELKRGQRDPEKRAASFFGAELDRQNQQ